ncbi:hypothetical protein HCU40_05610 [Pseudanabaena biceps]|nr:hypothetical protein [Pseudanabaena biceps]
MKATPKWLHILVSLVLVLGIFFRVINIDQKIYWSDESFTSLRVSGYTEKEMLQQDFQGNVINVKSFQEKYQNINNEKNVVDTITGLGQEEAQLPPLYFLMARIWTQFFGASVAAIRSLSVVFSLLAIAAIYCLCLELFKTHLSGLISVLIMSISPFHILFAQEARPYSLWTLTIILSSLCLLRAMRIQDKKSWLLYTLTTALSLYSFLFSVFVIAGQALYVITIEKFRISKIVTNYLRSTILAGLFFIPWILVIINNIHRSYRGVAWLTNTPKIALAQRWIINLGRTFVDFGLSINNNLVTFYSLLISILVIYSIYFLIKNTPKKTWLFVVITTSFMLITLGIPDVILGGQRSATCRYMIPLYIGSQISISYLFSKQLLSISVKFWQNKLWQILLATLSCLSIYSCIIISQSDNWWNKEFEEIYKPSIISLSPQQQAINDINKLDNPLLISDADTGKIMSLSHQLDSNVNLLLVVQPDKPFNIPTKFKDIFVYSPSKSLQNWLSNKDGYTLKNFKDYENSGIWILIR